MQLFLERLLYFWAGITVMGLLIAVFFWAIKTVIYIAFISLFVALAVTSFYHFYWNKRDK
tara:strand:- start:269 stop:448 length:180 start_codon:yes stop_codon:yes gene_type:complete